MTNTLRIGKMPGTIQEYALNEGTTVAQALEIAGLDATGFEVKVDGNKVTDYNTSVDGANLLLLTKMVKGNANTVRVGKMPGTIQEYAFEPPTSFAEVLTVAGLDATGFEVKADGVKITDFNQEIGSTSLILLTKMVKGNDETVRISMTYAEMGQMVN